MTESSPLKVNDDNDMTDLVSTEDNFQNKSEENNGHGPSPAETDSTKDETFDKSNWRATKQVRTKGKK